MSPKPQTLKPVNGKSMGFCDFGYGINGLGGFRAPTGQNLKLYFATSHYDGCSLLVISLPLSLSLLWVEPLLLLANSPHRRETLLSSSVSSTGGCYPYTPKADLQTPNLKPKLFEGSWSRCAWRDPLSVRSLRTEIRRVSVRIPFDGSVH